MKTVLVNPNNRNPMGELAAIEPPLWALMMAADFQERGHEVVVLDAEMEGWDVQATTSRVLAQNPDIIIIVVMGNNPAVSSTPKMPAAETLRRELRPHQPDVFLSGLHPMAQPETYTLFWKPSRCFGPDWKQVPVQRYRAHNWHCLDGFARSPYAVMYTSLGCPFKCYYCPTHVLYDKVMRRDILEIEREAATLAGMGVRNIKIWDELFALNEERVLDICEAIAPHHFNAWAYARLDTVTERMLAAMKEAGINWLAYGFERMSDPKMQRDVERAINMTHGAGINIIANFMFGLPGETDEEAQATLAFAKSHLFEYVNFYVARPYPGSPWFDDCALVVGSWEEWGQYGRNRMAFRDNAFREYFTAPDYLSMVGKRFGEQARNGIETMVQTAVGV